MRCYDGGDCNQLCEEFGLPFMVLRTEPHQLVLYSAPGSRSLQQDFKRKGFSFVSVYCHKVLTHYLAQAGLELQILLL